MDVNGYAETIRVRTHSWCSVMVRDSSDPMAFGNGDSAVMLLGSHNILGPFYRFRPCLEWGLQAQDIPIATVTGDVPGYSLEMTP